MRDTVNNLKIFSLVKPCIYVLSICVQVNDEDEIALKITTMAFEHSMLRDELFVQLCKQTTNNASDDIP